MVSSAYLSSKTPAVEATLLWLFVFEFALLVLLPGSWREEIVAAGFTVLLFVAWKQRHSALESARFLWLGVAALAFWMAAQPFLAVHWSSIGWKGGVVLLASFGAAAALPMLNRDGRHDKALRYAMDAFEYFIVAQLVVSFFSGIGEFQRSRTGSVRAFGFLSDSVSPIVGFFIVRNALERRHLRCFVAAFALAVTGGKAALGITIATFVVLLVLAGARQYWPAARNGLVAIVGAYFCVQAAIALEVPPNQFYALSLTEEERAIAQIELRALRELRSTESGEIGGLLALTRHLPISLVQAGANRLLSYTAALEIIHRHPLVGAGFNRSHDYIPQMVRLNPGGINSLFVDPAIAWSTVTALHNPSLLVFAELGLIGLMLFWIVCIGIVAVFWKTRHDTRSLAVAALAWGTTFVLLYQTTGWIEPGHPQLVFLALCVGIAIEAQSRRTSMPAEAR